MCLGVVPIPCLEHTVLPCFMALFFDQICICQENALEIPYALEKKVSPSDIHGFQAEIDNLPMA